MHGFKLFPRANIHKAHRSVASEPFRKFAGFDQNPRILFVAAADVIEHFGYVQLVISLADLLERFLRLKRATAATTDMITAEQGALRAGKGLKHFAHRRFAGDVLRCVHWLAKNFWISR